MDRAPQNDSLHPESRTRATERNLDFWTGHITQNYVGSDSMFGVLDLSLDLAWLALTLLLGYPRIMVACSGNHIEWNGTVYLLNVYFLFFLSFGG